MFYDISLIIITVIATAIVTAIVAFFIHKFKKISEINEHKMLFYNKSYNEFEDTEIRGETATRKDIEKNMKVAKYILKNRNLCESDGIWKYIREGITYISNGTLFPLEEEYDQKISEENLKLIKDFNINIKYELFHMNEKYEKIYFR